MAGRPKGFARWNPSAEASTIVGQAQSVLNEYRSYGPMTARQIFYRLVGQYEYAKTEKAYKRLCEILVRARRAQLINFGDIRDDGTVIAGGGGFESTESAWATIGYIAKDFTLNRMVNQPHHIELWCEAAGMVPMLENAVSEWNVSVYSTGGFSSVTVTHQIAQRVAHKSSEEGKDTVFLHIGDYDPSGVSIYNSMDEDISSFLYGYGKFGKFAAYRVALTEEQVIDLDIPTAPPKYTDTRSANWEGETAQCEAIPPDILTKMARDAVEQYIDMEALAEREGQEADGRAQMRDKLEDVIDFEADE